MALIKHVDGVDIQMTPEEEAAFIADLPAVSVERQQAREPTKAELKEQLDELAAKIEALP